MQAPDKRWERSTFPVLSDSHSSIEALLLTLYLRMADNVRKISSTVILSLLWN